MPRLTIIFVTACWIMMGYMLVQIIGVYEYEIVTVVALSLAMCGLTLCYIAVWQMFLSGDL